jgi:hypothetical protein
LVTEVATAYRSPSRTSATSTERADSNGGAHIASRNISARRAASGVPGMAMPATSSARRLSVVISTRCRGSRSASVESSGPPSSHGR